MTAKRIEKGDLVHEYVGEVINDSQFQSRRQKRYMMRLQKGWYVDAFRRGNQTRFINHGCDPNCRIEKIQVDGERRLGIYAIKHIRAGTFLSVKYGWQTGQVCKCGSPNCTGTM
jgi:histone-lysine N-methyltransferase SETD2